MEMETNAVISADKEPDFSPFQTGGHKGVIIDIDGKIYKRAKKSEIDFYKWLYKYNRNNNSDHYNINNSDNNNNNNDNTNEDCIDNKKNENIQNLNSVPDIKNLISQTNKCNCDQNKINKNGQNNNYENNLSDINNDKINNTNITKDPESDSEENSFTEKLKKFLPKFNGTKIIDGVECLFLENLHSGYEHPNTMDIKLGKISNFEKLPPEKIQSKRLTNSLTTSNALGFRVCGILISDENGKKILRLRNQEAKVLINKENIKEYFAKLITKKGKIQKDMISEIIKETQRILHFFKTQREKKFISSSLYYVFGKNHKFQVRYIDMAYTFDSDGEYDVNTIEGIENVINVWKSLVDYEC